MSVRLDPEYSVPEKDFIQALSADIPPDLRLENFFSGAFCSGSPLKNETEIP